MKNFRFHLKIPFSKHRLICQPGCCAQVRPPDHRHQCHHPRRPPLQCLRQAVGPKGHRKNLSPILLEVRTPYITTYTIDAVGLSQIFFPTQNLERAYQVDKESKAVLQYFQYDQCAGPQKQEDINGHTLNLVL